MSITDKVLSVEVLCWISFTLPFIMMTPIITWYVMKIKQRQKEAERCRKFQRQQCSNYLDFLQSSFYNDINKIIELSDYSDSKYKDLYIYSDDCGDNYD